MGCGPNGGSGNNSSGNHQDDDGGGTQNQCTYHLCSDTNLYQLGWENFSQAGSIWTNPNASYWQRFGAGAYIGAWGGAHVAGAVGVAGLACAAAGACLGAVEGWLGIGAAANGACGGDMCASEAEYIRYMSEAELRIVHQTGLLRGGNLGLTHFTTEVYETVGGATSRLSIPTPPDVGVAFRIINNPQIFGPNIVDSWANPSRLGYGTEYWTSDPVQVIIQNVWSLM